MPAIELEGVSKRFILQRDRPRSFQELFLRTARRDGRAAQPFWALRDVTCTVSEGQVLAVIGENGSGKSTLLKLVARILEPTRGRVRTQGRVAALLELGAGFHPELTGRENIYLNSSILGMGRAQIRCRLDEIVAFAELERFIDVPVKHYSSGMYVRLGFAVATCLQPEILLVDEILAVGDLAFQAKCLERVAELRQAGTTIVLVTHDLDSVRSLSTSALWLDEGSVAASGPAEQVIAAYRERLAQAEETRLAGRRAAQPTGGGPAQRRWGSREIEITSVRLIDDHGRERHLFETGQPLTVRILYRARQAVARPVFGLALHRDDGTVLAGPNTRTAGFAIDVVQGSGHIDCRIEGLPFLEGNYDVSVSAYDETLTHAYDHQYRLYPFRVRSGPWRQVLGFLHLPCSWSLAGERATLPLVETAKEAT